MIRVLLGHKVNSLTKFNQNLNFTKIFHGLTLIRKKLF